MKLRTLACVESSKSGKTIDLVLIDQQSVGKRSLHLMDSVNGKKKWTNFYKVTRIVKERALFLKINDINDILLFGTPDCHHCCSIP
jgi:hypothetical protein